MFQILSLAKGCFNGSRASTLGAGLGLGLGLGLGPDVELGVKATPVFPPPQLVKNKRGGKRKIGKIFNIVFSPIPALEPFHQDR
jgi:hypothetical protein